MLLTLEKMQEIRNELKGKTVEEISAKQNELIESSINFTMKLTEDQGAAVINFLEKVPQNPGFSFSAPTVVMYDKLKDSVIVTETVSGASTKFLSNTLAITDIRTLQKLLVESKPTSISEMRHVKNALGATDSVNKQLGVIEESMRFVSQILADAEREEATGLEFSKESNETSDKIAVGDVDSSKLEVETVDAKPAKPAKKIKKTVTAGK